MFVIARISPAFSYGTAPPLEAVVAFAMLMMIAGGAFLALLLLVPRMTRHKTALFCFVGFGLLMRLIFFGSTPIYEDDWYRYLWDGAVLSNGVNPYVVAPADASLVNSLGRATPPSMDPETQALQKLGADNAYWPERINYPFVTTIYPPVAQAAFALAHLIEPFNLNAWRFVLLIVDVVALGVILHLLKRWNRSPLWVLLYWWNPLVIFTTFSAAHMDILLVPFVGAALLLVAQEKPRLSAIALGAAAGVKFWPIILAPVLFRRWRANFKMLASITFVFFSALLFFVGPMFLFFAPEESGLSVYANTWQRNAFLFPIAADPVRRLR